MWVGGAIDQVLQMNSCNSGGMRVEASGNEDCLKVAQLLRGGAENGKGKRRE